MKSNELDDIITKMEKTQSKLTWLESELQKRQNEMKDMEESTMDSINQTWMNRVKMHDEIDKAIGSTNDNLKTKKLINDENSEE